MSTKNKDCEKTGTRSTGAPAVSASCKDTGYVDPTSGYWVTQDKLNRKRWVRPRKDGKPSKSKNAPGAKSTTAAAQTTASNPKHLSAKDYYARDKSHVNNVCRIKGGKKCLLVDKNERAGWYKRDTKTSRTKDCHWDKPLGTNCLLNAAGKKKQTPPLKARDYFASGQGAKAGDVCTISGEKKCLWVSDDDNRTARWYRKSDANKAYTKGCDFTTSKGVNCGQDRRDTSLRARDYVDSHYGRKGDVCTIGKEEKCLWTDDKNERAMWFRRGHEATKKQTEGCRWNESFGKNCQNSGTALATSRPYASSDGIANKFSKADVDTQIKVTNLLNRVA